jgi:hypothetical protein
MTGLTHLLHQAPVLPSRLRVRRHVPQAAVDAPAAAGIVMVQVTERPETAEAIHRGCLTARTQGAPLALVVMVPVQYVGWLGTDLGDRGLSKQMQRTLRDGVATAEDYGVPCTITRFQYATWVEGTVQAAQLLHATTLIAPRPPTTLGGWRGVLTRAQRWQLTRQGCTWMIL